MNNKMSIKRYTIATGKWRVSFEGGREDTIIVPTQTIARFIRANMQALGITGFTAIDAI